MPLSEDQWKALESKLREPPPTAYTLDDEPAEREKLAVDRDLYPYITSSPEKALEWERVLDRRQDREQRKKFATPVFWFVCVWLAGILGIVVMTGAGLLALSDTVLVALLGTTTANIIGLFAAVAHYLFPKQS